MSNHVVLCLGRRAEIPYCVPVTGMNIYSVEELCYFFRENAFLIDESIANKELVVWLSQQCNLSELADILYPFCKGEKNLSTFVETIVEYTGYFPKEEAERVLAAIKDCEGRSVGERKKTRADYYLENEKYELAIKEYELLLKEGREEYGQEAENIPFYAEVYFGMGMSFAGMFLFKQADYYFTKSYEIINDENAAFYMLAAKRLSVSEQEYICFIAEHPEFFSASQILEERLNETEKFWMVSEKKKQLEDIKELKDTGDTQLYYEEINRMTGRLKENFRRCLQE